MPTASPKKIAFLLGAGASKAYGVPVTAELLPLILKRIKKYTLFDDAQKRNDLKNFLLGMMPRLLADFEKEDKSLPLVTDVLSSVDYMILNSSDPFPMGRTKNLSYFRKLLVTAILEVLDRIKYSARENEVLERFAHIIYSNKIKAGKGHQVSLISTNYDCRLEYEIFNELENWWDENEEDTDLSESYEAGVDFGISWRDPFEDRILSIPQSPTYSIYKLHGSTNWLKCNVCGYIFINPFTDIYILEDDKGVNSECYCSKSRLKSHIVAPSLVRDIREPNLLHIWKQATETLRTADEWIVIGYSMPPEDIAIKTMLIRAFNARVKKPDITVVQFEKELINTKGNNYNSKIRDNYSLYFDHAENDFQYRYKGLADFLDELEKKFDLS